jgi:hypothetical protein
VKTLARPRDKADLVRRLRSVRPDSVRRWGRMSVHQMVCHLTDVFRMALGVKAVSFEDHLLNRTVVKTVALWIPLPWPRGIMTRPEVDAFLGGTRPIDFATDLAELEIQVERFVAEAAGLERRGHPIFGPLSKTAWLRWGYLHTDHHLRQFGS